jgi:prophage maintenance system killer protein
MHKLFNIEAINDSLQDFQQVLPDINDQLSLRRELFVDDMRERILEGYEFLNNLIKKHFNLFTPAGQTSILEMNHIVLCGTSTSVRYEYHEHILSTRASFQQHIKPIRNWFNKVSKKGDPFELAAGFYIRALSQPQLFIEGNHRTGNILINFLLMSAGYPPFIVDSKSAREYLELSGGIKFTDKKKLSGKYLSLPKRGEEFADFLRDSVSDRFIQRQ